MRISDWSSDVCSSDLSQEWESAHSTGNENQSHSPVAPGPRRRGPLIMSTPLPGSARVTDALLTERKGAVARLRLHRPELLNAFDAALIADRKSVVWERVCQYGKI